MWPVPFYLVTQRGDRPEIHQNKELAIVGYSNIFRYTAGMVAGAAMFLGQSTAQAQVTGTIDATIDLTSACEVNDSTDVTGVDFGTLDFGSHTTLFTEATAAMVGAGSAIAIQCSPGSDASLTITSGLYDTLAAGSGRALSNGMLYVPYDIYTDAAFANVLANGTSIDVTADGTVQLIPIYARALGNALLTPGTYNDTISVTLSF